MTRKEIFTIIEDIPFDVDSDIDDCSDSHDETDYSTTNLN